MRTPRVAAMAAIALAAAWGCSGPSAPPNQLPNAVAAVEQRTEEIIEACESGAPKAADGALHRVGALLDTINRAAGTSGLEDSQQIAIKQASGELLDAFAELHAPMHEAEFPEDFETAPICDKLRDGVASLRAALPAEVAQIVQEKAEAREASRREREADASTDDADASTEDAAEPAEPEPDAGAALPHPAAAVAEHRVAPLCPSVMLWDDASYRLAPERVNRVAELLAGVPPDRRWVQLVPTLHARLNADLTVAEYGTMIDRDGDWTAAENFRAATDDLADRLRDAFAAAIGQAVRRGLRVAILPHLDPAGGPVTEWRNLYDFAPGEVIGAGSYESLLLEPLAAAIEAEATGDTRIDLALCGEMGTSLFSHPGDYLTRAERLRERFAANPRTADVRIGVALNWSGVAGDLHVSGIDARAVRSLLTFCDFVGYSCYAPVSATPSPSDFAQATAGVLNELSALGVRPEPLPTLVLSEVGVGGGGDSVVEIAARPHEGSGSPRVDPWRDEDAARFRYGFHAALCGYLADAPKVDRAFLWSEGPWDPQGVADTRFRDERITKLIQNHNRQ